MPLPLWPDVIEAMEEVIYNARSTRMIRANGVSERSVGCTSPRAAGVHAVQSSGVTSACKQGTSLDVLVTQGRWQHLPTATHLHRCWVPIHGENHPPAQGPCFVCTNGQPFQNCEPERDAWNEDSWSAHCGPLWRGSSRRWRGLLTAESLFTVAYAGHEYLALTDGTGFVSDKSPCLEVLGSWE